MSRALNWQSYDLRLLAVAASVLISAYTLLLPELPNDDAYVYLRTAEIYLDQGLAAAAQHYNWPAYSVLIATLSQTGLSLIYSAYWLNAAFFALLVFSFVSIVRAIDASPQIVGLAVVTVLLYPELNEFRYLIIRDVAFWALMLFGLWQLIGFASSQRMRSASLFTLAILSASLFRAEALVYLLLAPAALLFDKRYERRDRLRLLMKMGGLGYGLLTLAVIILSLTGVDMIQRIADLLRVYLPFLQSLLQNDPAHDAELSRLLFGEYGAAFSGEYLGAVITLGLLAVLFMTVLYGVSGAYFWLLAFGALCGYPRLSAESRWPVLTFALINLAIIVVFLYVTRFLTTRYAMVLCLLLTSQVPLVVSSLWERARNSPRGAWLRGFLLLLFLFCAFDAYVSFGRSKEFLLQTAAASAAAPASSEIITNNHAIAYFSGRVPDYDEVNRLLSVDDIQQAEPGDILALELIPEIDALLQTAAARSMLELLEEFPGDNAPGGVIYRRLPD